MSRYITIHYRVGSNLHPVTDGYVLQNPSTGADPHVVTYLRMAGHGHLMINRYAITKICFVRKNYPLPTMRQDHI